MEEPLMVSHLAKKCECVTLHCPAAYVPNLHHILPQSWGGQTIDSNLIYLCPNSHSAVHDLLNQYIHTGRIPENDVLQHYNDLVKQTAAKAWAQRPSDHPPYTVSHP